jgi:transcriptional regulator with XRE-family HTH domain
MLGLTQQQLAEVIGVTYQQAHKYERGINRVSAGRLFEIARALSAPIMYFYEGFGEEGRGRSRYTSACSSSSPATLPRSGTRRIKRQ